MGFTCLQPSDVVWGQDPWFDMRLWLTEERHQFRVFKEGEGEVVVCTNLPFIVNEQVEEEEEEDKEEEGEDKEEGEEGETLKTEPFSFPSSSFASSSSSSCLYVFPSFTSSTDFYVHSSSAGSLIIFLLFTFSNNDHLYPSFFL